ncbi:MAG: serine/threonine protein kinase, partial [Planctomycetes bacterium]|nr:serine/threonine protein kinase [Planctomycetota bacterium]
MSEERDLERALNLLKGQDLTGSPPAELGRDLGTPPATLRPSDLLEGRYRVVRLLGRGGMGTVFLGQDEELGRRQVAIKVLSLESEAARERFAREAEVTARIRHPNVIRIHSAGHSHGQHYLIYEFVEGGRSLGDAFAERPLEERLDLLEQVASGLAAAHALGIIHRDLKPENVLILPTGDAVVADFGLAGLGTSCLTNTGQTLGTPAYMAPEQIRGDRPTPACDVWALGLLLYECVYRRHPSLTEGLTLHDLLAQLYNAQFDFPPGPAKGLRLLLRRTLVVDPSKRPSDAAEFRRELRAARRRVSPSLRRAALGGAFVAGVGLTFVVGSGLFSPQAPPPSPVPSAER